MSSVLPLNLIEEGSYKLQDEGVQSAGRETALKEVSHHLGGTGIEVETPVGESYEATQSLAHRLRREGIQAIVTYSARDYPDGRNVILFLENIDETGIVERARAPV